MASNGDNAQTAITVSTGSNKTHQKHGGHRNIPPATLRRFLVLEKNHPTRALIAKELAVAESTIDRWRMFVEEGRFQAYLKKMAGLAKRNPQTSAIVHRPTIIERALASHNHNGNRRTYPTFVAKIIRYRAQGLSGREISAKAGVSQPQVYYWLAKVNGGSAKVNGSQGSNSNLKKGNTNGVKNPFNKNILLGIAYAETERFIANIAPRIKIPAQILRRRLPELLGHSPLWE